jgi:hypothetical protein
VPKFAIAIAGLTLLAVLFISTDEAATCVPTIVDTCIEAHGDNYALVERSVILFDIEPDQLRAERNRW